MSNASPTNPLVILGDAWVGETLIGRPNGIRDADGINYETQAFQWLRDGEPIFGATEQTYEVTSDDIGTEISLQYSYTDNGGTQEVLLSQPKPLVPEAVSTPPSDDEADPTLPSDDTDVPDDPSIGDGVNDTPVSATRFQDIFTARAGMDSIDGREGVDTIVFPGDQSNYVVTFTARGAEVSDKRLDGLGTMSLENIEIIGFETAQGQSNPRMDLRQVDGYADLSSEQFEALIEIYIAYYNRAPDSEGLAFWSNAYADGMSLEDIAQAFATQPETLETYPPNGNSFKFVSDVYQNALGRAPDPEGLKFWAHALDNEKVSKDELILEILRGAKEPMPEGTDQALIDRQLADQQYLDLKTDLGAYFAVHRGMSNTENAAQIMDLYDGSAAGFETAIEAIDVHYGEALMPGSGEFLMPLVGVIDDLSSI